MLDPNLHQQSAYCNVRARTPVLRYSIALETYAAQRRERFALNRGAARPPLSGLLSVFAALLHRLTAPRRCETMTQRARRTASPNPPFLIKPAMTAGRNDPPYAAHATSSRARCSTE